MSLEPFVSANVLRFDSWSPDSRWIGYWMADGSEEPAVLAFAEVDSGEVCVQNEVVAPDTSSGDLYWQEDGSVVARLGPEPHWFSGSPCERFQEDNDFQAPDPRTWVEESPNRFYSAETQIFETEGALFHTNLRITELETSKELFSFNYIDGAHAFYFGPSWLNDELYLIGYTLDQGILYYSVTENKITRVLPDFFELPISEEENITKIVTQVDPSTGNFHLLFETVQGSLLHHSELDQVEYFQLYDVGVFNDGSGGWWGFSPDGKWLLLFKEISGGEFQTWYRSLDPPGSSAAHFTVRGTAAELSSDGTLMVIFRQGNIALVSFPDGHLLSNWRAANFYLNQLWRSPAGTRFVAHGSHKETGEQAIFIIEP